MMTIPSGVVVKFEQRDSEQLHVFGYCENLCDNGQVMDMDRVETFQRDGTYYVRASERGTTSCIPLA